jgi:ABC-type sugar transport system ATPase subunit
MSKAYPGVVALDEVDLDLYPGEIHALVGENGSGKSTLMKILYGAVSPDKGSITVDGSSVSFASPRAAKSRGIVAVTQELTLAPTLSVAENVALGALPRRGLLVDWQAVERVASAALDDLDVDVDPLVNAGSLPVELQQEIEVARAIAANPRVLILDEATSSLSEHAAQKLFGKLTELREGGSAIVFISHRLHEIYECAS